MPLPTTGDILTHACLIIKERGWAPHWSHDDESSLNLRSAISRAVTELAGRSGGRNWRNLYTAACAEVQRQLRSGILDWESRVKASSEVEAMLTEVVNRLDSHAE